MQTMLSTMSLYQVESHESLEYTSSNQNTTQHLPGNITFNHYDDGYSELSEKTIGHEQWSNISIGIRSHSLSERHLVKGY